MLVLAIGLNIIVFISRYYGNFSKLDIQLVIFGIHIKIFLTIKQKRTKKKKKKKENVLNKLVTK